MIDEIVRKRFCTSCQSDRVAVEGSFRYFGNAKRWVCQSCTDKAKQREMEKRAWA